MNPNEEYPAEEVVNISDPHEYVLVTTVNGFQACIHFNPAEMLKLAEVMKEAAGAPAFVTLSDVDTGDLYLYPGNVETMKTFSAARFRQMKREEEKAEEARKEAMKLAARGMNNQLIVPGQNRAQRRS